MNKLISILLICVLPVIGYAQNVQVTGRITDALDGAPLPGATVQTQGKTAVIADNNGYYSIAAKVGDVLRFSFLGMVSQNITVEAGKTVIDVALANDNITLDEVIMIGYGTVRKKDVTGAVSSIKEDKLKESVAVNLDQMLTGKLSGVQVTQNSGAPGGAASIRIRGTHSINNSSEPLYIVDGIPFAGSNSIAGFGWAGGTNGQSIVSPLSTIAPADIVSIDVLKDASATAIYGVNGGNGVILITTRRGKAGQTRINYEGYLTIQDVAKKLDMMDLRQYARYQVELGEFFQVEPDPAYLDPSILGKGTDWQDVVFRTAIMQSHQLSLTGGSENLQLAASGGYTKQDGIVKGSDFTRFNSRLNVDGNVFKWLKAGASLAYARTEETIIRADGTDGVIFQALTMQPSIPVYNFDGSWAGPASVEGTARYNPLWLALMQNNQLRRNRLNGTFYANIDIFSDLNLRSEYAFDYGNNSNMSFMPSFSIGVFTNPISQILQRDDESSYWTWRNYATYRKTLAQHNFSVMAGMEVSASDWSGNQLIKQGLSTNDIKVITSDGEFLSNNGWKDRITTASFFGRLNYNFDERYLATFTLRADASSVFGSNKRWGYFPSAALAWRLSQEEFLRDNQYISNLKLRLGYGQVGNSNIGTYLYGSSMVSMTTPFGTAYRMRNISNSELGWEASEQYNVGLDFGMFNDRISLTVDYYQKYTKGLLLQSAVPSYLGGSGENDIRTPMVNTGEVVNKGVDITLNTINFNNSNFTWNSNLVFSLNRNKVLALNDEHLRIHRNVDWYSEFQTVTLTQVGQPVGVFYGYVVDRLFTNRDDILNSPVQVNDPSNPGVNLYNRNSGVYVGDIKFKDLNGDGVIDNGDQTIIGDPNPDFTFGFSNSFTLFKDWEIGLTLVGVVGFDIFNFARFRTEGMTSAWDNQVSAVANRAQVGVNANGEYLMNPGTTIPRPSTNDFNRNNRMSDRFIEDGTYVRIQNLSIAYNLPTSIAKKFYLNSLKVYVNLQNLYTFTGYSGYDPEIGAFNQSSLLQNVDRGRYPTPRSFVIGLNFGF